MALIRQTDESGKGWASPATLALAINWGLRTTCYVEGCEQIITTICSDHPEGIFALCEEHFQAANVPGGCMLKIVW